MPSLKFRLIVTVAALALGPVSPASLLAAPADPGRREVKPPARPPAGAARKAASKRPVAAAPGEKVQPLALATGLEIWAVAAAKGRQAFLAQVAEQVRLKPLQRRQIVRSASAFGVASVDDITRAADIMALLAADPRALVVASALATSAASRLSPAPDVTTAQPVAGRSVWVSSGWGYLNDRPVPASVASEYGWTLQRRELNASYSANVGREFGANWGNAAVGQAEALNRTSPGGQPGITGRGVTVAVIDSGIDARFANPANPAQGFAYVHPEFFGRLDMRSRAFWSNGTWDLSIQDDTTSHGTHVAGTIGAAMDGVGMMGIAPGANILALKAVGANGDPIQAMNYAASQPDVRIINGSYGPSARPGETTWHTGDIGTEYQAVGRALAAGKVLVFATGNDFATAPIQAQNPTGIPLFPFIRPQNALHGAYNDGGRNYDFSVLQTLPGFIVAVANLDHNLVISADSNRCGVAAAWCVSAPGGGTNGGTVNGILSTVRQGVAAVGGDTPTVGPDPRTLGYAYLNGTSMATPHVSGVIAVLMEAYPTYSAREIVRLMFATAQDLGARGVDRVYGHGLVRLDWALAAGPQIDNIPETFVRNVPAGQPEIWAAPISTQRGLVVQGTRTASREDSDGDLIIAGVAEFGDVVVESGDLVVEGTLKAPRIEVRPDSWLMGDGTIHGNIVVDGTLKPGVGPGEMQIHGNVAFNPGARFHLDIDGYSDEGGPGSYSYATIIGAGHSFRAGGLMVAQFRGQEEGADNSFTPKIGDRFRVVRAVEGARVEGKFTGIDIIRDDDGATGLPAFTRLSAIYRPTSITLSVDPESFRNLSPHGVTLNRQQAGVGAMIDALHDRSRGMIDGPAADFFERLEGVPPVGIGQALQQLAGAGHAVVMRESLASTRQFSNVIGERVAGLRAGSAFASLDVPALAYMSGRDFVLSRSASQPGASASPPAGRGAAAAPARIGVPPRFAVWGKMFAQWANRDGDRGAPSSRSHGGGGAIGADLEVGRNLILGAAVGYAGAHTKALGLSGQIDSYFGALYGAYTRDGFEADATIGMAYAKSQLRRELSFGGVTDVARSTSESAGWFANAELGYRFRFDGAAPAWAKPFIGMGYNSLGRNGFSETGAGSFGLAFPFQRFDVLQGRVGIAFGASIAGANGVTYLPEISIAGVQDLDDGAASYKTRLFGEAMVLPAGPMGRGGLQLRPQIAAQFGDHLRVFAAYAGEFRAHATSHRVEGGLRLSW